MIRLLTHTLGSDDFELVTFETNNIPTYAILSHTWTGEEVTYEELVAGRGKNKSGYAKICEFGKRAADDGIRYFWVDTCCIDKSSSAELSETLNSMYSWYQKAHICYAYLDDWQSDSDWVDLTSLEQEEGSTDGAEDRESEHGSDKGIETSNQGYSDVGDEDEELEAKLGRSHISSLQQDDIIARTQSANSVTGSEANLQFAVPGIDQTIQKEPLKWFTRGWTLQELIAPHNMKFYNRHWHFKGAKSDSVVVEQLSRITGISSDVLGKKDESALRRICLGQRMSWAAFRQTSREEDIAYCLLGIFDVHMPMLYGEGRNAFFRLQEEILKHSTDLSIFGWTDTSPAHNRQVYRGLLSRHPREFRRLKNCQLLSSHLKHTNEFSMTNKGIRFHTSFFQTVHNGTSMDHVGISFMDLNFLTDGRPQGIRLQKLSGVYARVLSDSWDEISVVMRRSAPRTLYVARDVDLAMEHDYNTVLAAGVQVQLQAHHDSYVLEIIETWPPDIFDELQSTFLATETDSVTGFVKVALTEIPMAPVKRRRVADFNLVIVYSPQDFRTYILDGEHATRLEENAKSTWEFSPAAGAMALRLYHDEILEHATSDITLVDSSTDAHFRVAVKRSVREQVLAQGRVLGKAVKVDLYKIRHGEESHVDKMHA